MMCDDSNTVSPPSASRRAEHTHRAGCWSGQADGEVQQRRLPGAVRADEGRHRARWNLERAVPQRPRLAVALAESPRFERKLAHAACSKKAAWTVAATSALMLSSSSPAFRARSIHLSSAARKAA